MTTPAVSYNLSQLHVARHGTQGPHLLLLHGWGQTGQNLRPLGELLAHDFQVHLIDLPGFGASPRPTEAWSTEEYQELLVRYLAQQNISQVILVGHSMGGRISLRLAAQHPELVTHLGLIASHGVPAVRSLRQRIRNQLLGVLRAGIKRWDALVGSKVYSTWYIPRFASRDYKAAGPLLGTFLRVIREDLTPLLSRITAPALLLYGDKDTETPVVLGRRIAAGLKKATFIELPGKDHEPFKDVGSHLLATMLRQFFLSTEPPSGATKS